MARRKKGWLSYRGKFAGLKANGIIRWKTLLERDYLYLLEYDRSVLAYENCHLEIQYIRAGETHVLNPDLLVRRGDSPQLIKLVSNREQNGGRPGLCLPAMPYQVEGYDLIILTEAEVRQQPFLNNVKALWRYARVPVEAAQYQLLCFEFFRGKDCATLGELIAFFARRRLSEAEVFALIFRGVLSADMTAPLTRRSSVNYPGADAALKKGA